MFSIKIKDEALYLVTTKWDSSNKIERVISEQKYDCWTEQDYQEALVRIESLMDAKEGSDEGVELACLAELVEKFEQKYL